MDTPAQVIRNEKGMVLIYVAVLLTLVLGFLGLVVDSGHLFKVRTELQNAADAAALKGAYFLYTMPTDPTVLPVLQWDVARAQAEQMITENSSDNAPLKDAVVDVGYWNMSSHMLQSTTLAAPTAKDVPAVRVVTSRSADNNGGPVTNYFMQLFNTAKSAVGSRPAVAVKGGPGSISPGGLFPLALSQCMVKDYFDQDPLPDPPTPIEISSLYGTGGDPCYSGQWTTFQTGRNDANIGDLMDSGNSTTLKTGDDIWIEPGAEASVYSPRLTRWLPEGGKDVLMAVVAGNVSVPGSHTITGFATFHIDSAQGGNIRKVFGHFTGFSTAPPGSMPGGIISNTLTKPVMVQ